MNSQDIKKFNIPDAPGVYLFKKKGDPIRNNGNKFPISNKASILYIGKATSLKDRVKSYFSNDLISTRGPLILDMVFKADKIDFIKTDSVLEALILESELIKKHQPKYNTKEKDDRSYNFVVITDEDYPRVLIERGRSLEKIQDSSFKIQKKFGPYTNGTQLREAVKIIRKIFPFRDKCLPVMISQQSDEIKKQNRKCPSDNIKYKTIDKEIILGNHSILTANSLQLKANIKPCFNYQIGLCPGVCAGKISKEDYAKTIKNIELFFEGKKKTILKNLEKEMSSLAKNHEFEKAGEIKKTIFALNHIQDVALIRVESSKSKVESKNRIEAYDIAHMSGQNTVGVMTVIEDGKVNKNEYRKFSARGGSAFGGKTLLGDNKPNDIGALKEILERRFAHNEWFIPKIIVVDGGKAQIKIAREVMEKIGLEIPVVSVVKDEHHRPKAVMGNRIIASKYSNDILLANNEAHRFAINYHKNLRNKAFLA